jgi:hypothetical protein
VGGSRGGARGGVVEEADGGGGAIDTESEAGGSEDDDIGGGRGGSVETIEGIQERSSSCSTTSGDKLSNPLSLACKTSRKATPNLVLSRNESFSLSENPQI